MALLTDIQNAVVTRLAGEEFFSQAAVATPRPVPVLAEQSADASMRIRQHLGAPGIACVVLTPTATANSANRMRPYLDAIQVVVRVQETVALNRAASGTGQPASLVAEAAAWCLHGFAPAGVGGALRLQSIRLVADAKAPFYETTLTMEAGMKEVPVRLPTA